MFTKIKYIISAILLTALANITVSCVECSNSRTGIRIGQSSAVIQEKEVSYFNVVEFDGDFEVAIRQGNACSLTMEGTEDILNMIIIEEKDEVLKISQIQEDTKKRQNKVLISLNVVDLVKITGERSLKIITPELLTFDNLHIDISGAVNMDMNIHGNMLTGDFKGASSIKLAGKVAEMNITMPGAGKIKAFDLMAENVVLELAGAGKADITAIKQLKVDMSGACMVAYKGNPENVFSNISGIGRLKKVD